MYKKSTVRTLYIISGTLLFVAGILWYNFVYLSTNHVFWRMIDNSLNTSSFSRQVKQSSGDSEIIQTTYMQFSPTPYMNGFVTVTQGKNVVETELFGTLDTNLIRYSQINPAGATEEQLQSLQAITNSWASQPVIGQTGFVRESIYSVIPIGNLSYTDRVAFKKELKNSDVYKIVRVEKSRENGRPIYSYTVQVDMSKYLKLYQKFAVLSGVGELSILQNLLSDDMGTTEQVIQVAAHSAKLNSIYSRIDARRENIVTLNQKRAFNIPQSVMSVEDLQDKLQLL